MGHAGWGGSGRGGLGHVGVGWVMQGWGGSCRGGVGQTWLRYLTAPPVGCYKGKHDYKMHFYHDHTKILHTATTKQGSRNIKGTDSCLAYDMGGWRHWGPPFSRHAALRLFHCFCLSFVVF